MLTAEEQIEFTLREVKFFDRFATQLNSRQLIVITRMFDEGITGFTGGMNASKYIGLIWSGNEFIHVSHQAV